MQYHSKLIGLTIALTLSLSACTMPPENSTPNTSTNTPNPTSSSSVTPSNPFTTDSPLRLVIKGDPALLKFNVKQARGVCLTELKRIDTTLTLSNDIPVTTQDFLRSQDIEVKERTLTLSFDLPTLQTLVDGFEFRIPQLPVGTLNSVSNLLDGQDNILGSVSYNAVIGPELEEVILILKPVEETASGAGNSCGGLSAEITGASLRATAGGIVVSQTQTPSSVPSTSPSAGANPADQNKPNPTPSEKPSSTSQVARIKLNFENRFLTKKGETRQLSFDLFDAAGNKLPEDSAVIEWSSNRPQDIFIDSKGKLTAISGLGFAAVTVSVAGTEIKDAVGFDVSDPVFFTSPISVIPEPTPTPTPIPTPTPTPPPKPSEKVNGEFLVNTTIQNDQSLPSIARAGTGDFVVSWNSGTIPGDIRVIIAAQRYDKLGNRQGAELTVSTNQNNIIFQDSAVAMHTTGSFIVTWESNGQFLNGGQQNGPEIQEIHFQRYSNTGNKIGVQTIVNTTTAERQSDPAIAMDNLGNYVITWTSNAQDGSNDGIYFQRYNSAGNKIGTETLVNTTTADNQSNSAIAMDNSGNYVVTWKSNNQDGSNGGIYFQRFDNSGAKIGNETLANTTTNNEQSSPAIAMNNKGEFIVAWTSAIQDGSDDGVYFQRFDSNGDKVGTETLANTTTTNSQSSATIAMSTTGFMIGWSSSNGQDGDNNGIFAQKFDTNGAKVGNEFQVNTTTQKSQDTPALAMDADGTAVFAWQSQRTDDDDKYDIYAQQYTP